MGKLVYGGGSIIAIPDDGLAMLEALTGHLYSQGQGFTVVIRASGEIDEPLYRSLWFSPQVPVQFLYEGYETFKIQQAVFAELCAAVVRMGTHYIGATGPLSYELTD